MTIAITPSEVMLVLDVLWHQSLKGIAHILLQAPSFSMVNRAQVEWGTKAQRRPS